MSATPMKTVVVTVVLRVPEEENVGSVYAVETRNGYYDGDDITEYAIVEIPA